MTGALPMKKLLFPFIAAALLVGCSHKISQSNFDKVKEGMTKAEVVAILGEPKETEVVGKTNNVDIMGPVWEGDGYKITAVFSADDKLQTKNITKW